METVYCPVIKGQIDGVSCLEIVSVADRVLRPTVLPKGIVWSEEAQQKCLHCKWHDDLAEGETAEDRAKAGDLE